MAGYNKLLKRKGLELDHVRDDLDLSDFPLSAPASKIRRLDAAELAPIAEVVDLEQDEPLPTIPTPIAATEELEAAPNEERALVLFKPLLHSSSSPFSLTLSPDLLSQFKKDQAPWSKHGDSDCDRLLTTAAERQEEEEEEKKKNRGMALVPWVPSSSSLTQFPIRQDSNNTELMEADDESGGEAEGSMMMEVEQQDTTTNPQTSTTYPTASALHLSHGGIAAAAETSAPEGLHHQWQQQQQHCLLPQIPQSASTPHYMDTLIQITSLYS